MRAIIKIVIVALFLPAMLFAQENFEGRVTLNITTGNTQESLQYIVKENKFRIEHGAGTAAIILPEEPNIYILRNEENTYMEVQRYQSGVEPQVTARIDSDNLKGVNKTGEMREIQGYNAEKWEYSKGNRTVEAWVTEELGGFVFFASPVFHQAIRPEWQSTIEGIEHFPLLVTVTDASGREEVRMEATNIERTSIEDSMFEVPNEYRKVELPAHREIEQN
jgi:hypothetical protein